MILQKYNAIMEREEAYRKRWATGLSIACWVLVLIGFGFYKGLISFDNGRGSVASQNENNQVANVISAEAAPSPIETSKETFSAAFEEIGKQYQNFKDSLSAVFVPFVTGIDVYKRE